MLYSQLPKDTVLLLAVEIWLLFWFVSYCRYACSMLETRFSTPRVACRRLAAQRVRNRQNAELRRTDGRMDGRPGASLQIHRAPSGACVGCCWRLSRAEKDTTKEGGGGILPATVVQVAWGRSQWHGQDAASTPALLLGC